MQTIPNELTANFGDIQVRRQLMQQYGRNNSAYSGVNADGEQVLVSISTDSIVVATNQSNGWIRKNYYDAEGNADGETYDGKWK